MNDANNAKAQLVEKLKSANNILVSVSANPTVDQLAASIALTLLLNNYKKNATAVFSGKVPSILNFLKPKETFEQTTDSLRDFIIALDKSKADKLRYKVEDDVVKIFITPYKTSITEHDLKYSAGDFNIDLILALGVQHQQDLDAAITAHGRIFHDAVVMSINNMPGGDLGVVNWEDLDASSLSELIANLIDALDPSLLDRQVATALLTGIVAETSRFSNEKTHPRTMNVSSTLLAAGADQQLVNNELQDLIGAVVTLKAGSEIKPTEKPEAGHISHDDVAEELVIDETGAFHAKQDAVVPQPAVSVDPPAPAEPVAAASPMEAMIGTDVESTPAPILDQPEDDFQPTAPTTDGDVDEESARQAIETALADDPTSTMQDSAESFNSAVQDVVSSPAPEQQPQSVGLPAADAMTFETAEPEPIFAPEFSSAAPANNPLISTPSAYTMPTPPEHEPAPLSMSPADQPFTMPLPPSGSMASQVPAPDQPFGTQPQPGFVMPEAAAAQPLPPPLPPPMMPPAFPGQ